MVTCDARKRAAHARLRPACDGLTSAFAAAEPFLLCAFSDRIAGTGAIGPNTGCARPLRARDRGRIWPQMCPQTRLGRRSRDGASPGATGAPGSAHVPSRHLSQTPRGPGRSALRTQTVGGPGRCRRENGRGPCRQSGPSRFHTPAHPPHTRLRPAGSLPPASVCDRRRKGASRGASVRADAGCATPPARDCGGRSRAPGDPR